MSRLRNILTSTGYALALMLGSTSAYADFPDRPIKLVTPYPPGGSHSLHAGIITTVAEPFFSQPMISVIRAGGGGIVGANDVLNSPADGYTLLFGDPTINSLRPQVESLPYKADDFTSVARINYSPAVFVAAANAPFDDLKSMIDFASSNPDKLVYAFDNPNGFTFVAFEMLKHKTNTKMKGIPFGGGGPALAQVLGGHTMAYAGDPSVVGDQIAAKNIKAICVTDTERFSTLPDVPTCREQGVDVIWQFWRGILVKKDTPQDIVDTLREGFSKLTDDDGFKRLIKSINSSVGYMDKTQFDEMLDRERKDLKAIYDQMQ